jgi:hypothetical protein
MASAPDYFSTKKASLENVYKGLTYDLTGFLFVTLESFFLTRFIRHPPNHL